MRKVIGVIPARFASTRFPGKPLALINGKPMIEWVVKGALTSKMVHEIAVATDDNRIAEVCRGLGVRVFMTDSDCPSGSDRIWQAVENLDHEIIINIQGDEPLVTGKLVDLLTEPFLKDPQLDMATLAHPISAEELLSDSSVKVVVNSQNEALYFSRFPIPYSRRNISRGHSGEISGCLKHIGMYGYTRSFLKKYCGAPQAELEVAESLEQLRALYLGARMKVVQTTMRSWGVDTPEDLARIENMMANQVK